jgi:hypothetical protein
MRDRICDVMKAHTVAHKRLSRTRAEWAENEDKDPAWMKLPRGDRALQHKIVSTAVAKTATRIMEEIYAEAALGAIHLFIEEIKASHLAQQRLEQLRFA